MLTLFWGGEMSKNEERLYEPIAHALTERFSQLGDCHLENTSKKFSEQMKGQLDDYPLLILSVEKMSPDLTGYLTRKLPYTGAKQIIVVEIKIKPTLKDIYQTKRYAEILNASYALLISPNRLSPERRRFLIKRKEEITRFYPDKQVIIGKFFQGSSTAGIRDAIHIERELYYNLPEPFKE